MDDSTISTDSSSEYSQSPQLGKRNSIDLFGMKKIRKVI